MCPYRITDITMVKNFRVVAMVVITSGLNQVMVQKTKFWPAADAREKPRMYLCQNRKP